MTDSALLARARSAHRLLLPALLATALAAGQARAQQATGTPPATPEAPPETAAETDTASPSAEPATQQSKEPAAPPPPTAFIIASRPANPNAPAPAPAAESESAPDDGEMGSHRDHVLGTVGLRVAFIPDEGLDPFSADDVLAQFSLGAGSTVYGADDFSIAALLLWDTGGTSADARGDEASLSLHRFTAAGEGRYHFFRRLYAFGRVAPGALRWDASLEDGSVGYTRETGNWMFALDLSAGTTFEFAGETRGKRFRPRGWFSAEAGYGWTTSSEVSFAGDDSQGPARVEPLAFNDLALRGGYFRLSANLTY
ncbi:MAG TPA: hypothetical protein VGK73_09470 [Polyangiaceae bacterium]